MVDYSYELKIPASRVAVLIGSSGSTKKKIEKDTDRDYFMSAEEAKEYGVIDDVIYGKPNSKKK